jgi:hypothetical protein
MREANLDRRFELSFKPKVHESHAILSKDAPDRIDRHSDLERASLATGENKRRTLRGGATAERERGPEPQAARSGEGARIVVKVV